MPSSSLLPWRLGVVLSTFWLGSWHAEARPVAAPSVALQALETDSALGVTYDLPVVPVAPVPDVRVGAGEVHGCPFEVRAIIGADDAAESRAYVAWEDDMEGAETQVLKVGQSLRVGGAAWQVSRIDSEQLVLARGDTAVRCALAKITR